MTVEEIIENLRAKRDVWAMAADKREAEGRPVSEIHKRGVVAGIQIAITYIESQRRIYKP